MKRILFFEIPEFTGATRVTRTIEKKVRVRFETRTVVIRKLEKAKREIEDAISNEDPDILFSSFSVINSEVILAGKKRGLVVVARQDYKLTDLDSDLKCKINDIYPKADWILVQTAEMKNELLANESLRTCRIKVIENPIDEEEILEKASAPNPFPDNGNFHFLWVGRKDPIKDLPTLQKAFEIVKEKCPKTDLTLVSGDPNPYRWMKNADCLVISSLSEASPNVLQEALFLGTKVVSTDCSPTVRKKLPANMISKIGDYRDLAGAMMRSIQKCNIVGLSKYKHNSND